MWPEKSVCHYCDMNLSKQQITSMTKQFPQGHVALGLFELCFSLLFVSFFLSFSVFFDEFCKGYDCVQSVIWLNKEQITNGTELCHLAVCSFFCIKGFISLELWATISHAFALVKCEILFLVQTGVTSLPIARRDTLRAGGEKDFCRCKELGWCCHWALILVVCDCGHDAEEFDQRNSSVITVIWAVEWYKPQKWQNNFHVILVTMVLFAVVCS